MKKTTNYINYKGEYVNVENKTLTEIYNEGKLEGWIMATRKHNEIVKAVDFSRPQGEREFIKIIAQYVPANICVYPEYKGKPYYSIEYKQNGEEFVGFGTYNIEVLSRFLRDYFFCPNCGADMRQED